MSGRPLAYPRMSPGDCLAALKRRKLTAPNADAAWDVLVTGATPYRAAKDRGVDQSNLRRTLARIVRTMEEPK